MPSPRGGVRAEGGWGGVHQQLGHASVAVEGGVVERRPAVGGVARLDIRPLPLEQPLHLSRGGGAGSRRNGRGTRNRCIGERTGDDRNMRENVNTCHQDMRTEILILFLI